MDKDNQSGANSRKKLRTAIERMESAKGLPPIVPLLGDIWQENELQIFFADTGTGKSIFATALADALSKGETFLALENAIPPQKVIYYDFELSDRQFRKRYTDEFGNEHIFSSNLLIDNIDFKELIGENPETNFLPQLMKRIRLDMDETDAKILIIDNITFLNTQSPQDTDVALSVMRELNVLSLSISVLHLLYKTMSVQLRTRKLKDGRESYYLDIYTPSGRITEALKLYKIVPNSSQ